jgi:L-lactate dehydrogenase
VAASICKSILFNQRNVKPVSHYQDEYDVCLSKPAILSRNGIEGTVELPLNEEEKAALGESAKEMRRIIDKAEGKGSDGQ